MAKYRAAPLTDEQRAEKRELEQQLAAAAVQELTSSDGWQQWLTTRAKFHRYSFGNQLLIAHQHETAERVAGFRQWLELGYCVRKGEHGIRIWAPCPPSKKQLEAAAAAGTDAPRTFFRLAAVFAQDQVEPLPPPAVPQPLELPIAAVEGDELAPMFAPLVELGRVIGSSVTVADDIGHPSAAGCYDKETCAIMVRAGQSPNSRVKVLVHELAHALVRADKQEADPTLDYASEELVVESVAMSVCGSLGLDTAGYSIPYLASWADRGPDMLEVIKGTAQLVNRLACRIEDALAA